MDFLKLRIRQVQICRGLNALLSGTKRADRFLFLLSAVIYDRYENRRRLFTALFAQPQFRRASLLLLDVFPDRRDFPAFRAPQAQCLLPLSIACL